MANKNKRAKIYSLVLGPDNDSYCITETGSKEVAILLYMGFDEAKQIVVSGFNGVDNLLDDEKSGPYILLELLLNKYNKEVKRS